MKSIASIAAVITVAMATSLLASGPVAAQGRQAAPTQVAVPPLLLVRSRLAPAPAGVNDLKFNQIIKTPVGPLGLEPTDMALGLTGKRVRMVGFMVRQDKPTPGLLILTPMPLSAGDEDESLSDDLPGNAVFVHLAGTGADVAPPYVPGLVQLTGTFAIGPRDEADSHVSSYRMQLDRLPTQAFVAMRRSLDAATAMPTRKSPVARVAQAGPVGARP